MARPIEPPYGSWPKDVKARDREAYRAAVLEIMEAVRPHVEVVAEMLPKSLHYTDYPDHLIEPVRKTVMNMIGYMLYRSVTPPLYPEGDYPNG